MGESEKVGPDWGGACLFALAVVPYLVFSGAVYALAGCGAAYAYCVQGPFGAVKAWREGLAMFGDDSDYW